MFQLIQLHIFKNISNVSFDFENKKNTLKMIQLCFFVRFLYKFSFTNYVYDGNIFKII